MMNGKNARTLCALLAVALLLSGCTKTQDQSWYDEDDSWSPETSVLTGKPLADDESAYKTDDDADVACLYVTVLGGKDVQNNRSYTFEYLKNYTPSDLAFADEEPFCDIIMREGTEKSSFSLLGFGFAETMANAKLTIKGDVDKIRTRSFKIKLLERAGLWRGQRTINLVKDINDMSRMKQKLCFDGAERFSDISSLRTQFVRLFVYDATRDGSGGYEDMGVYLAVEQPNKAYLDAHGFDATGTLYRAERFDFSRYAEVIMPETNPGYSEKSFEKVLKLRENADHEKLIGMLEDVNNADIDTDTLISKYFNEENLLTYAAINIIYGNVSAYARDYLLYSPKNSSTWYISPYSFKNAFADSEIGGNNAIPKSIVTIGFLQNNVVFRRYLEKHENLEKLKRRVEEVYAECGRDFVAAQVDIYRKAMLRYVFSVPDIRMLPRGAEFVEPYVNSLSEMTEANYKAFMAYEENPIVYPYITAVEVKDGKLTVSFYNDPQFKYSLEMSTVADFSSMFGTIESESAASITSTRMPNTDFFVRVAAIDAQGNKYYSTNITEDKLGKTQYGSVSVQKGVQGWNIMVRA